MTEEDFMHTDLACERCKVEKGSDGVWIESRTDGNVEIHTIEIKSESGAKENGMKKGKYTTLSFSALDNADEVEADEISRVLAGSLSQYLTSATGADSTKNLTVMIAGLGNRHLTTDAVGPLAVDKIIATRHISEYEPNIFTKYFNAKTVVITPGVLSQTGIESADMIRALCEKISPDVIIAIDALAARDCERLSTTIQLCDTGITPGSGIGNHRSALDQETLGCPVIAIGVPTVVDSATLVYDAIKRAKISDAERHCISDVGSFFVSPKECDTITQNAAKIISQAINDVLN